MLKAHNKDLDYGFSKWASGYKKHVRKKKQKFDIPYKMKQYVSGFLVVRSMSWPINQLILLLLHTLTNQPSSWFRTYNFITLQSQKADKILFCPQFKCTPKQPCWGHPKVAEDVEDRGGLWVTRLSHPLAKTLQLYALLGQAFSLREAGLSGAMVWRVLKVLPWEDRMQKWV